MLNKLFHFLKGYVIIEVYGSDPERFINICVRRNFDVRNIERRADGAITLLISKKDFFRIRPVVYKTRSRVRILKKAGFSVLRRKYGKHYTFFAGIILAVLFFAAMSRYIWVVEINGVYESDYNLITEILKDDGVYVGAKKKSMSEKRIIKQSLVNGTETVAWAWIYIEGAKARVEIYEKNLPSIPVEEGDPCDIVAASDGYIEKIMTVKGEERARNGTAVSRGDILISGKVGVFKPYEEEKYIYVHSSGTVRALTYHEKSGVYSLIREKRTPTGKREYTVSLELFGKEFVIFGKNTRFTDFDEKSSRHELNIPLFGYSGICLNTKIRDEVGISQEPMPYDTAVEIARNDLEEKLTKELLKNPELKESDIECESLSDTQIKVTLKMTVSEDIGVEQAIEALP